MTIPTSKENSVAKNGHSRLAAIVADLQRSGPEAMRVRNSQCKPLPSRDAIIGMVEALRSIVFPRCFGQEHIDNESLSFHLGAQLDKLFHVLREQINRGLCFRCEGTKDSCEMCEIQADEVANQFLERVPTISSMLHKDVRATFEGDPAAKSEDEIIFCYPGINATLAHRIAHELFKLDAITIARIMSEYAHSITGIDIHPGATIGENFMIDHGTGVVIGETCVIGNNVRIYQGVTLGAKSFPVDKDGNPIKGVKRHPNIEDDVIIYSGATILGNVTVGKGSVIGGNVWLTEDVPPGTRVLQNRPIHELYSQGGGI